MQEDKNKNTAYKEHLAERLARLSAELEEGQLAEVLNFAEFVRMRPSAPQISAPTQKIDWGLFRKHQGCYDGSKIDRMDST